ncbi:NRPS [Onygenales sp. PD_12]|nr:NRPS [Onygenales sp. PD_12]
MAPSRLESYFTEISASTSKYIAPKPRSTPNGDGSPCSPEIPSAPCIITDLIFYQVQSHPHTPAIQFEDETPLSYVELWDLVLAIQSAASFKSCTFVAVCMTRSVEFVAVLLAILKSGAAYVTLDPDGSPERNRTIVEDCNADVVVVHKQYGHYFKKCVSVERLLSDVAKPSADKTQDIYQARSSDAAYLIYTSGSTGTPKGVIVSHAAASYGINHFSLNRRQRWLLFYNPIFSAAQRSILATLAKGACLCLASREKIATSLMEVIREMEIDAVGITPSALTLLSEVDIPMCLKQITTVGEPLSQELVDRWADKIELRVSYGLSECAQLNFARLLKIGDNPRNPGRPLDTTTAIILVPGTHNEVQSGEPGELCLYGQQISNGYHNRPMETARSFIKNPFGRGILYRTGDFAVQQADGTFEILGRLDYRIKINSQSVEPEEIAVQLGADTDVLAITCVGAKIRGKSSLVAAIAVKQDTHWSQLIYRLRQKAQTRFPGYMVPSYWLQYATLPLNTNGKVDISSIRQLAESTNPEEMLGLDRSMACEDDITPAVSIIRASWATSLSMAASSIHISDSFVSLGGTSIEAIRVIRDLKSNGIIIELADILRAQTLQDIAYSCHFESKPDVTLPLPPPFSLISDDNLKANLIANRGISDAFPVTPLQEGLLASTLKGSEDYLYQRVFDIRHLDLVRLRLAFQVVFWQSEILRSTFSMAEFGLVQIVRNDLSLPWKETSMSLATFLELDKTEGITLGQPLVRISIVDRYILVVSIHHALFDFWSHRFFFDDVADVYGGLQPTIRPPWATYIRAIQNQDGDESKRFWSNYLAESSPTILNHSPASDPIYVSRRLSIDLKQTALAMQTTSSAIFYAAWGLVLSKHTASSSVVMGVTLSGRDVPVSGIEKLNGPTLTLVPLALRVQQDHSLKQDIQEVNNSLWDVVRYSQYGIRKAVAAAGHRSSELFDTMVNIVLKAGDNPDNTKQIFQTLGPQPVWKTEFTTLNIEETISGLELRLSSCMEPLRLEFLLDQFVRAVEHIANDYNTTVESLDLVGDKERCFLLEEISIQSPPRTLHGQFELMAKQNPSRIAIQYQAQEFITYQQMEERSNQMANYLAHRGISQGDIVPLLLGKSPLMIIAMFSLLKIGAAFIPLGPENPLDRNMFIALEVGAKVVLTETEHGGYFPANKVTSILLDQVSLKDYASSKPEIEVLPGNVGYLINTSGSTGVPKSVVVTHGSCSAAIKSILEFEGKENGDFKNLLFSNYVFDASLYDIFTAFHSGATLCLARADKLLDGLAEVINEMQVGHLFLTPTVARLLNPDDVPSLKSLTVGGEPVTQEVVDTWGSRLQLRNAYGPSETSIIVSMHNIVPEDSGRNIGRALPSVFPAILESNGNKAVPYGAVGELCISGPHLAAGYLNQPEITAKAFVQIDLNGNRRLVYRTGDLVRFLPGKEIEYMGRKDDQCKVSGYRIELGEIEHAMIKTGQIKECSAIVGKYANKAQIVAFVVFESSTQDGILDLKQYSSQVTKLRDNLTTLPPYMIPKAILPLGAIPRMPSGKTNRKFLKVLAESLNQELLAEHSFDELAPSEPKSVIQVTSPKQKALQTAWSSILRLESDTFGLEANFLRLGGDSIAAINLVSQLRKTGYLVSVGDILKYPNLKDMANRMREDKVNIIALEQSVFRAPEEIQTAISTAGLTQQDYEDIYPCPPGQAEFLAQGHRSESFWCLMAIRPMGKEVNLEKWTGLLKRLAETNDILRTTYTLQGGKWYGVVLKDSTPIVGIHTVTTHAEKQGILERIWREKFIFGRPFIRYAVLQYPDGELEVVTKMDHALYDGTLLRVFASHFRSYQENHPLEKFTSFRSFAFHIWQSDKQPALGFWTQPSKRPIQFGFPELPGTTQRQPQINSIVSLTTNTCLESLVNATGTTPSIIFQAVFQIWLAYRSGKQDVAFDYLYTGRNVNLPNPQSINGTCANFLPMRSTVHLDDDDNNTISPASWHTFLQQTQDDFWQYTEHYTMGLADIYSACQTTREASGNHTLFLFQPFEPAAPPSPANATATTTSAIPMQQQPLKWIVMAESQVTMPQPYALVMEVAKTASGGHKLKFAFDDRAWNREAAERELFVMEYMVKRAVEAEMARGGGNLTIRELVEGLE